VKLRLAPSRLAREKPSNARGAAGRGLASPGSQPIGSLAMISRRWRKDQRWKGGVRQFDRSAPSRTGAVPVSISLEWLAAWFMGSLRLQA